MSKLHGDLMDRFGVTEVASNSKSSVFEDVAVECPTCGREPVDWAILNKKGEILCSMHWHHDHVSDYLDSLFDKYSYCGHWGMWINDAGAAVSSFRPTRICSFCNEAEGRAKRDIGASKWFTFTIDQLREIVRLTGPGPVSIDLQMAETIWQLNEKNLSQRMRTAEWLTQAAIEGRLGPIGHPIRITRDDEPRALRSLSCDGGYSSRHLAKKLGF